MPTPEQTRVFRRRRALVAAVAVAVLVTGGATIAWAVGQQDSAASGVPALDTSGLSPSVAAQLEYAYAHWDDPDAERFGVIDENDCVNFTSQTLLARGWATDDEWWYDEGGDAYASSDAWISSTMLRDYLLRHPERATPLTDDQRDQVKVGDIVQFDWDDSGDRDHTGVITAVVTEDDGSIDLEYAGHTDATWNRSVEWSITEQHPHGVAYYWSIPE
ncbi:hypothetical protein J2X63_000934 [Agromyces sp. 3263]|uniref:amidase domain-containing protein n=1 Tax=Agromyces sp. 3263 TaxID=2817750 RepID=UPI0028654F3D|nr:amidase domain-containing protein [Agromyces sp. 3263]MDR6905248.1 hypothetical protein [Agromyces sp. 3263]